MIWWKQLQQQEFNYLDKLDLKPFLISDATVHSVMDSIEKEFQEAYVKETGDEYLFNVIDVDDFAQYLKERYNTDTYEYTEFRIR